MYTDLVSRQTLAQSVIAVPPLARDANLKISREENQKVISYLEAGGITTLLYGGNAVLAHVALSEYADLLAMLAEQASDETLVIPSAGPAYGQMLDQAAILKDFDFPTAMVLPQRETSTPAGVAVGVRRFAEALERPVVLYIKHDGYIAVDAVQDLMEDGLLSAIKYAVVRPNPREDQYLREIVASVGPERIVSGMGEQPAIVHLREFGLSGFTSGCVCIRPDLSMRMLHAMQNADWESADQIRETFSPLEDLRNDINPVRVLHEAVQQAGIADTGPILPLLSPLNDTQREQVKQAAEALLQQTAIPQQI